MRARASVMREVAEAFEKTNLKPMFDVITEAFVWKSGSINKGPFLLAGHTGGGKMSWR